MPPGNEGNPSTHGRPAGSCGRPTAGSAGRPVGPTVGKTEVSAGRPTVGTSIDTKLPAPVRSEPRSSTARVVSSPRPAEATLPATPATPGHRQLPGRRFAAMPPSTSEQAGSSRSFRSEGSLRRSGRESPARRQALRQASARTPGTAGAPGTVPIGWPGTPGDPPGYCGGRHRRWERHPRRYHLGGSRSVWCRQDVRGPAGRRCRRWSATTFGAATGAAGTASECACVSGSR